jgi:rhodanese-related sulfurtransferase
MPMKHAPAFLDLVNDAKTRVRECTVTDVKTGRIPPDSALIDVREESEFASGHIPGAIHMSKGIIERDIEAKFPNKSTPLVLYCGGGFRSALAGDNLQRMGYTNVLSMDGGMRGWREAGYTEVV